MITIHCGLHKTGSTAIQLAAAAVSRKNGRRIHVPSPAADASEDARLARLEAALSHPQVIFSDENLLGAPFDGYLEAEERACRLSQVLRGQECQVVVYLRPQHSWLPSVFTQAIQEGRDLEAAAFLENTNKSPWLLWSNLVRMLRQSIATARIVPRVYFPETDVVADFFRVAGLGEVPNFGKLGNKANVSIPAVQIPIVKALLRSPHLDRVDASKIRALFQELLAAGAAREFSPFSASEQDMIRDRYRGDWQRLAADVTPDFPSEATRRIAVASDWPMVPMPDLSEGLENPVVIDEMIRSMGVMATTRDSENRYFLGRVLMKLRRDPLNLPAAIGRSLRR